MTRPTLGPQDYVIVTLKAYGLSGAAQSLAPLLGPETAVVFAVNGVPWWYFYGLPGPFEGRRLESVDPGGRLWEMIGPERVLGCVVYPAAEIAAPGVVRHLEGRRFSLGEPGGQRSQRVLALSRLMTAAGLKAPVRPQLRDEIWVKLWGNCSLNPVSALTGATVAQICRDPGTRVIIRDIMLEAQAVGQALGVRFPIDVERRLAGAEAVGEHRTSMLQDLERGRPLEIEALVGAVQELARLTDTPTPVLDLVSSLLRQRVRIAGCGPG